MSLGLEVKLSKWVKNLFSLSSWTQLLNYKTGFLLPFSSFLFFCYNLPCQDPPARIGSRGGIVLNIAGFKWPPPVSLQFLDEVDIVNKNLKNQRPRSINSGDWWLQELANENSILPINSSYKLALLELIIGFPFLPDMYTYVNLSIG